MTKILRLLGLESRSPVELESPHSKEECLRRLRDVVVPEWSIFGKIAVAGRIRDSSIKLHKRAWYKPIYKVILLAALKEQENKTLFDCRFRLHGYIVFFVIFFLTVGIVGFAGPEISTIFRLFNTEVAVTDAEALMLVVLPIALISVVAGIRYWQFRLRKEPQFLIDFLRDQLDATEVESN